jgi:hypothetical protein
MSVRNKTKAARRAERAAKIRKPALFLAVPTAIIKGHRYLRAHGLPHSSQAANVELPSDQKALTNA